MNLTVGSLFAGIGGLELGLERAGMTVAWQVEIDPYCRRVLAKHWPDVPRWEDVRTVGAHNLPRVDVICGGFPCQDISNAGKRAGIDGERSGLWGEYARIIRELRPRYAIVENVAALLARGLERVLGDLAESGYDAEWDCIPAAAVGAPHIRDRLFLVAYPQREGLAQRALLPGGRCETRGASQRQIFGVAGCMADSRAAGCYRGAERHQHAQQGRGEPASRRDHTHGCADPDRRPHARGYGEGQPGEWWLTEPDVGRVANGVPLGLELLGGLTDGEGNDSQAHTAARTAGWKVLRALWGNRAAASASPHLFGDRLRDIVPGLPCPSGLARWVTEAEGDEELRDLWERFYTLPFEETHDLQQALLERARASERRQTVAFRQQRVNRLRALGNAVVPQVAEYIGRQIVAADQQASEAA